MPENYFLDLNKTTESRFWINNPTKREAELAIEQGAIACTTNPAYCSRLIEQEKSEMEMLTDGIIKEHLSDKTKSFSFDDVAFEVYQQCAKRIMDIFMPGYDAANGKCGFVTLQDDPRFDEDTERSVKNVLKNVALAPNYMAKIPVISGGIEAIEACVEHNIPICATEVFAISQAITICSVYENASKKYGNTPPMYVTHISGIFDEYLYKKSRILGIDVSDDIIFQAGTCIARKENRIIRERGYNAVLLGGGARNICHFTDIIGGPHITINWSTALELLESDLPVRYSVDDETDPAVIKYLTETFPEFAAAYSDDGLSVEEYADFAPVQLFRNAFIKGWYLLLAFVAERRNVLAL